MEKELSDLDDRGLVAVLKDGWNNENILRELLCELFNRMFGMAHSISDVSHSIKATALSDYENAFTKNHTSASLKAEVESGGNLKLFEKKFDVYECMVHTIQNRLMALQVRQDESDL